MIRALSIFLLQTCLTLQSTIPWKIGDPSPAANCALQNLRRPILHLYHSHPCTRRLREAGTPFEAERDGNVLQQHLLQALFPPPCLCLPPCTGADAGLLAAAVLETQLPANPLSKVSLRSPFGTRWPQVGPTSGSIHTSGACLWYLAVVSSKKSVAG